MQHVHVRAKQAALKFLQSYLEPIPAEILAEHISYTPRQTQRIIAALREDCLITCWRPRRSHALAYRINEPEAIERGLLP